jgi:hypothetical protein
VNPQNVARLLSGAGQEATNVLRIFGKGLIESGILKPAENFRQGSLLTKAGNAQNFRKGQPFITSEELVNQARPRVSVVGTRPQPEGQMSLSDIPLARPTTITRAPENFRPAPEPQFPAPYRSSGIRPAQITSKPAPEPQFPAPGRQLPTSLETFSQLQARDPGTASSMLQLADRASSYYGVPREEVLRGMMGGEGTNYLARLEGAGPGALVRSPEAAIAQQDLRSLSSRFGGGAGEVPPTTAANVPGGRLMQSPGGELANKNVLIPDNNFYIDVESRTVSPDLLNAVGGVRTGNLGALAAVLGGGAAAGLAVGSRFNQGEPSLGETTTAAPSEPNVPASKTSVYDDRLYSTPLPENYRGDSPYLDPSAGPVKIMGGGARDSAVREQIQQYARGQGTQDTRASKPSALQAQYAQESLKARANIGEIINELGYNASDKAPLRQWAVQNPALAMRLFEQQQAATAEANNLRNRSTLPTPGELAESGFSQQSPGNVESSITNTSLGSNLTNNAIANSHFRAESAVAPSQGAYDLADATQAMVQPVLITDRQLIEQAPAREYDTAKISDAMLRRAMELKMGQFQTGSIIGG